MSSSPQLSIDAFPAWARLNNVDFGHAQLQETEGKGLGLVVEKDLRSGDGPLLRIPHDLVLSAAAVEDYAKVDQNFRQLLEVAGQQSTRGDILLYLLTHLLLSTRDHAVSRGGPPTPWTEYIKFLPRYIPVPTKWTQVERALLQGTSLEAALDAKLATLTTEFDELHEKSSGLAIWNTLFWEKGTATIDAWVLVDAWYRSRSLELPRAGDAMVPGLDMVNHSGRPTAYYEEDDRDDIVLLLRPSSGATCGEEMTISYGEAKSAAEMLFSYGFVDPESATHELVLPLEPMADDPLGRAKLHTSKTAPSLKLFRTDGKMDWESPFAYLMCLNEEDGLEFRVLQGTDGERQLRLFWQDEDVTAQADDFETLIQDHPLCPVFKLRVVAVLHELVTAQLERLSSGISLQQLEPLREAGLVRQECLQAAEALREIETSILESAAEALEIQVRGFVFLDARLRQVSIQARRASVTSFGQVRVLACLSKHDMPLSAVVKLSKFQGNPDYLPTATWWHTSDRWKIPKAIKRQSRRPMMATTLADRTHLHHGNSVMTSNGLVTLTDKRETRRRCSQAVMAVDLFRAWTMRCTVVKETGCDRWVGMRATELGIQTLLLQLSFRRILVTLEVCSSHALYFPRVFVRVASGQPRPKGEGISPGTAALPGRRLRAVSVFAWTF
ncbi:hypothetical protein G7046_g6370 [Stylonectria norvegica]|nr:hypothetical protein G7046_g6370 [Stylonectria norvegica]